MNHSKTKLFLIIILLIIPFQLSGCKGKEPIKVGFVACLTGSTSELGVTGKYGAQLAIDEINKTGGILGRKLELIIEDDKNDQTEALNVDKKLIDQGVIGIIGHMTSGMAKYTVPLINEKEILMITPTMSINSIANLDDYLIRLIPNNEYQAKILGERAIKDNIKKMAIIYEFNNSVFTTSLMDEFQKLYKNNGEIVYVNNFTSGVFNSYDKMVEEIISSKADGVLLLGPSIDDANFFQSFKLHNGNLKYYLPMWAMTEDILQKSGNTGEGAYFASFIDYASTNSKYIKFVEDYTYIHGKNPSFGAFFSYECVMLLKEGIIGSNSLSSKKIKNYLSKIGNFNGIQGDIEINRYGDSKREKYLYTIKNNKFVKVD